MPILSQESKGLTPYFDRDLTNAIVALPASHVPRLQVRRLQLWRVVGGRGCNPEYFGTSLLVRPLYVEHPQGSGTIVLANNHQAYAAGYKEQRNRVVGIVSPQLLAEIEADPDAIAPGDPNDLCVLGVFNDDCVRADTVAAVLKQLHKARIVKGLELYACHRESTVDELGYVHAPECYLRPDQVGITVLTGRDGITRDQAECQAIATRLMRAAKGLTLVPRGVAGPGIWRHS